MPQKLNTSEQFVHWVCRKTFLSLWSYAAPRGKSGKELCDIFVVCDPDIIIISVKNIKLQEASESPVAHERWTKRAIDESVRQIYGAERWLESAEHVVRLDGSKGLSIPDSSVRRVHRVAIAFGAEGKVGFTIGEFGKGYIHVLDERSFHILLSELDTISDFVRYLTEKERFTSRTTVMFEGEENLLALYLHGGRRFPEEPDTLVVGADLWEALIAKPEFNRRDVANRDSYSWDRLIEIVANDMVNNNLEIVPGLAANERPITVMAREDRFCRRLLGKSFLGFVKDSRTRKTHSRLVQSPAGVSYVFLRMPSAGDRQKHLPELTLRCFVARSLSSASSTVIGIGVSDVGNGFTVTLLYYDHPTWTEAHAKKAKEIQEELDYFRESRLRRVQEDEYPKAPARRRKARPHKR